MPEKPKYPVLTVTVFVLYCLILVWIVLLKLAVTPEQLRWLVCGRSIDWIPFRSLQSAPNLRVAGEEVVLNGIVFIPLGLMLSLLGRPRRLIGRVAVGFLVSLAFELIQYAFAIGVSDVTDLLMNTLGTLAGCLLFFGAKKLLRDRTELTLDLVLLIPEALCLAFFLLLALVNR